MASPNRSFATTVRALLLSFLSLLSPIVFELFPELVCGFGVIARLQDKATEGVEDLVGVFKGQVAPERDFRAKDLYVSNVKPAPAPELDLASVDAKPAPKPSQARESTRRKSTGTNVMTRADSRSSNVAGNPADGQLGTRTGNPPRRNRRSSGFLSLLGYALKWPNSLLRVTGYGLQK